MGLQNPRKVGFGQGVGSGPQGKRHARDLKKIVGVVSWLTLGSGRRRPGSANSEKIGPPALRQSADPGVRRCNGSKVGVRKPTCGC